MISIKFILFVLIYLNLKYKLSRTNLRYNWL